MHRWCGWRTSKLFAAALARRKGVIVLTGHFGSWEVSTVAGLSQYPEVRGQIYFVRRPLKWRWLDAWVTRRFQRAGFGVLPKRGGLDALLEVLESGHTVVFPFDQHAAGRDAIRVDFFGHPAGTMRSLAVLALASGATVLPAASWREPDGRHVLRFEAPLPLVDLDEHQRSDPGQHTRLQPGAGAAGAAPPRAVVLGASAVEGLTMWIYARIE